MRDNWYAFKYKYEVERRNFIAHLYAIIYMGVDVGKTFTMNIILDIKK